MGPTEILQLLRDAGLIGGFVLLGWALINRKIVLGWVFEACVNEKEELRKLLNAHAAKIEAKIDRLEADRDKTHATPAS